MKKVLGFGAALVDILSLVDDSWVEQSGSLKGGMTLVDAEKSKSLQAMLDTPEYVPGGSACNTIAALSRLGVSSSFFSKVGKDDLGTMFQDHLKKSGVESKLLNSETPTGAVVVAVSPDAERTMFTYLGASDEIGKADLKPELFKGFSVFYVEGYRAFNADVFKKSLLLAKNAGLKTVVDFGSFEVIHACRSLFDNLFSENLIDIILANEEEAYAYTQKKEIEALHVLRDKVNEIAVVKLGSQGSLIASKTDFQKASALQVKAIDTTGAGDFWAAGFLLAYLCEKPLLTCGEWGSRVAAEVVQVMGPQISEDTWEKLKKEISCR